MNREFYILLGILLFLGLGTAFIISMHDDNRKNNPFDDIQHTVCLELRQKAVRYFLNGDHAEAENHLRRLLKISPDERDMQRLYGRVLVETGKLQDAEKLFRKMLSGNPLDWGARNNLGVTLLFRGQYEAADREFERASRNETAVAYTSVNRQAVSGAMEFSRKNRKFIFVMNSASQSQVRYISVITLSVLDVQER